MCFSVDKGLEALKNVKAASSSENVLFHQLDISDPESVAAFAKWIQAEVGEVTILVNNAGINLILSCCPLTCPRWTYYAHK